MTKYDIYHTVDGALKADMVHGGKISNVVHNNSDLYIREEWTQLLYLMLTVLLFDDSTSAQGQKGDLSSSYFIQSCLSKA